MIDVATEQLLTLSQAARLLPDRPSTATLWRWRTRGVRGRRLESIAIGGRIYTSAEALQRFARPATSPDGPPEPRTTAARARAIDRAERELSDAGI